MRSLWVLTKLQILQSFSLNALIKSGKKWKIAGIIIAVVYVAGVMGVGIYFMASGIARAFALLGQMELYPPLVAALVCGVTLLFSIPLASGTLYSPRELEVTLSMPVRLSTVVASRLAGLYIVNLPFVLLVSTVAILPYIREVLPPMGFYPAYLVTLLAAPLLPVVVAALIGGAVAFVAARFRGAKYIHMALLAMVSLGAMALSFGMSAGVENMAALDMAGVGTLLSDAISRIYPLAGMYTRAVARLDAGALLGYVGISLAVFGVFSAALGKAFLPFCAALGETRARGGYRLTQLRAAGTGKALLLREWRHLTAVPMWMFNSLFGLLLALIGAVALVVKAGDVVTALGDALPEGALPLGAMLAFLLSWLSAMSCTTGCSISLEGRSLWQIKSLPVRGLDVLHAKLLLNLLLVLPVMALAGGIAAAGLGLGLLDWLWVLLVPALYALLTIQLGLMVNLRWHRFLWTSEVTIVKQSAGVAVPVLVAMFTTLPVMAAVLFVPNVPLLMALLSAVLAAVDAGLYALIRRNAERWYDKL